MQAVQPISRPRYRDAIYREIVPSRFVPIDRISILCDQETVYSFNFSHYKAYRTSCISINYDKNKQDLVRLSSPSSKLLKLVTVLLNFDWRYKSN